MAPRRKIQAGVGRASSANTQPEASQGAVKIESSSATLQTLASNGQRSTATGGQSLLSALQKVESTAAVPKGPENVPKPKQHNKPKTNQASTSLGKTQSKPSQKPAPKLPSSRSPSVPPQQSDAATTIPSVPLSGVSRTLRSAHRIPSASADSGRQRATAKTTVPSPSPCNAPHQTRQFSGTAMQGSAAPFIPISEGLASTRVAGTFLQSSKASESNKTSPNLSKTPYPQSHKKQKNMKWKTSWMTKDAGELIQTIPSTSIQASTTAVSSELGFEDLCSYNWQENGSIVVPGGPPKWTPPSLPITLSPDTGHQFVDQNAFRMPVFPFEPAFQALSIAKPEVKLDDIDIVANRNSLRKFLDFAAGKRRDPWRMDLHMVKNTLFISRKEMNARAMVRGNGNSGYGHNFEKAFTKPGQGLDNSSSHHRVIRYRLGSLECAVRFEVDAYYEEPDGPDATDNTPELLDQITTTVAKLTISKAQPNTVKKSGTEVIMRGSPIDPSKLAEIKTRKSVNINDALPQLWFGRTPYLFTGKHDKGVFNSIHCSHVQLQFADWETKHQEELRKMVSVLAELRRILKDTNTRAAILVCDKGGPLQLFKMKNATGVLPKDMITKYWSSGKEV